MKKLLAMAFIGLLSTPLMALSIEDKVVEIRSTYVAEDITIIIERHKNDKDKKVWKEARLAKRKNLPYKTTCSGAFANAYGDILTARHCIIGATFVEVETADRRVYAARVDAISDRHDLALIHIDRRHTPYFTPAPYNERGDEIRIYGSPLSITNTMTSGIISAIKGDKFHVDCTALPGNSGGPVVNSDGQLAGIIVSGFIVYWGTTGLNSAQGIDSVYYFYLDAIRGREEARCDR